MYVNVRNSFNLFHASVGVLTTWLVISYQVTFPWRVECWLANTSLLAINGWGKYHFDWITVNELHSVSLYQNIRLQNPSQIQQTTFPLVTQVQKPKTFAQSQNHWKTCSVSNSPIHRKQNIRIFLLYTIFFMHIYQTLCLHHTLRL